MASLFPYSLFIFTLFSTSFYSINGDFIEQYSGEAIPINRTESLTHLHFYFHDILSGKNPSSVQIISGPPKAKSASGLFGSIWMIDDALTESQEPTSKIIGNAQGFYSVASQNDLAFLMVLNFVFIEGKYNGSSISILGRNPVLNNVREMPVVGGSGLFRFARGYALAHTVWFEPNSGDAIVEYNVYVLHIEAPSSSCQPCFSLFLFLFLFLLLGCFVV